jgi:hypothetical protein
MTNLGESKERAATEALHVVSEAIDSVQSVIAKAESSLDTTLVPLRKSVFERFPIVFLLAVTFGVTAIGTGLQQMLLNIELVQQ